MQVFYRHKNATKSWHQSTDNKFQEGHRFAIWESDKGTRLFLHHFEALVSKSFLQSGKATKRKLGRGKKIK